MENKTDHKERELILKAMHSQFKAELSKVFLTEDFELSFSVTKLSEEDLRPEIPHFEFNSEKFKRDMFFVHENTTEAITLLTKTLNNDLHKNSYLHGIS